MAATIGEQLRLSREERGIALREISNQTRIQMRYLEAIENNDFKRLPGGIFNRSFIKAYARCVGFDETQALEGYAHYLSSDTQHPEEDVPAYSSIVYTDTPATRSPILTVALAILILVILTLGALALNHWYKRRSATGSAPRRSQVELAQAQRRLSETVSLPPIVGGDQLGGAYEAFLE